MSAVYDMPRMTLVLLGIYVRNSFRLLTLLTNLVFIELIHGIDCLRKHGPPEMRQTA